MANKTLKSIAFPFARGTSSFPAMVADDAAVQAQMTALVTTGKGERVMRPEVGLNAYALIFQNVTPIMRAQLAVDVAQQIRGQIPKAQLQGVDVYEVKDHDNRTTVYAEISYAVAGQETSQQIPIMSGQG